MTPVGPPATRALCSALANAVQLYETSDPRTLRWVLLALTLAAVANAALSFVACLLPRRHVAKGVVLSLLILPVLILVPFLVLSARRDAMRLSRFGVTSRRALGELALTCDKYGIPAPQLLPRAAYDFQRGGGAWQTYIVLLFAGATAALGARISLALAANALGSAPASVVGVVETHSASEVAELLTRLRYTNSDTIALHERQCAICLEDMETSDALSRLECAHVFHEVCFEKWVKTAIDARCPMCKAAVWHKDADSSARVSWEGSRNSTQSTIDTVVDAEHTVFNIESQVDAENIV